VKITIATLRHSHDQGDDFSVHRDEDTARAAIYRDVVSRSWDNVHCPDGSTCGVHGCTGVSRTIGVYTTEEAIRIYFAHRDDLESHHIKTHDVDLTQPPVPEWVKHPHLTAETNHNGVTGQIHIAFTDADTAYVTTEPNTPLTYRGQRFHVAVHLDRWPDGTWARATRHDPYLTYHNRQPTKDAPPTFAAALLTALAHTTGQHWAPEIGERARYATASQDLRRLFQRRDSLLIELGAINTEAGPLLGITRTYVPPTETG
jgi:hypothetical protein